MVYKVLLLKQPLASNFQWASMYTSMVSPLVCTIVPTTSIEFETERVDIRIGKKRKEKTKEAQKTTRLGNKIFLKICRMQTKNLIHIN